MKHSATRLSLAQSDERNTTLCSVRMLQITCTNGEVLFTTVFYLTSCHMMSKWKNFVVIKFSSQDKPVRSARV